MKNFNGNVVKSEEPLSSGNPARNKFDKIFRKPLFRNYFFWSVLVLVVVMLTTVFVFSGSWTNRNDEVTIGILKTTALPASGLESITHYLDKNKHLNFRVIDLENTLDEIPDLDGYDVLWYHQPDSGKISKRLNNIKINDSIKQYLREGGNLLLTLDGMQYLRDLRVEKEPVDVVSAAIKGNGYGRKYGLHAYKTHPVFKGMNGGAYIFNPKSDTTIRQTGFTGERLPRNGKVIAVDWSYINLNESKKLMVEYDFGKGKIMGIGAYTHFSAENYHQLQLEIFMKNVFNYLAGNNNIREKYYWNYAANKVEPFNIISEDASLPKSKSWNEENGELSFTQKPSDNFWDVAGERMLVMGKKNGGIEEIWAHPFMALRDYRIGFRLPGDDDINWLEDNIEAVKVTPNAFTRTYSIGKSHLKEIITTHITEPISVIHYDYSGQDSIRFVMQYKTNIRLMWPYSGKVNEVIKKTFDKNLNAHLFVDESSELACIVGAGKRPEQQLSGRFSGFFLEDGSLFGRETTEFAAATINEFQFNHNDHLDVLIAATSQGLDEATKTYRKYLGHPEKVYQQSQKYYEQLLEEKLVITSPDKAFNKACQWAMIGADRFFVHTPGIGKSLVAGYATTAKGWNGGHEVSGRPGYSWYFGRDGQWSGMALNGYGDFEKVREILKVYMDFQNPEGKIFHELTTSGVVHYDAADATPLFIALAGHYLRHSGDTDFIRENWKHIEKAIDFCFSTDSNQDHLIENALAGHGWVEGGHLYGGRSTLYLSACWAKALEEAAYMADVTGKSGEKRYRKEARIVKQIMNDKLWNEQNQFFYHSINYDGSFIEDKTIMPAIPLYFNQIDSLKSFPVLKEFARDNFSADWGVRIVGKENDHFNPEGYHTGTVWPLYTGWTALAEYKNERPLQGFVHTMNNLQVYKYWSKGFIEEVLHGLEYKPSGVCAHQCWSETMALQPLYEGMLGFEPLATENKISLAPAIPVHWKKLKVRNIRLGESKVGLRMQKSDTALIYDFQLQNEKSVQMSFNPYLPVASVVDSVTINNRKLEYELRSGEDFIQLLLDFDLHDGDRLAIYYTEGIAIVPPVPSPKPGEESEGLRVISSKLEGNQYNVAVQGPVNSSKELFIFQGYKKIKYVENARLVEFLESKVKIEVNFRSDDRNEGYQEKTFSLIFDEE